MRVPAEWVRRVAWRVGVAVALALVYVVAVSPLRSAVARYGMAPVASSAAASGAVVTAPPGRSAVLVAQDGAEHALDVPFGRLWIVTAVVLAVFGAPRRAHLTLAAAVAVLGVLGFAAGMAGLSGVPGAWAVHAFLGFITVPVVAGVALLSMRPAALGAGRADGNADVGAAA